MKPTCPLYLALVLGLIATGCSTPKTAVSTPAIAAAKTDSPDLGPVIASLGNGFSISTAADSWPALTNETRPTFAWNGRDLLWIETDDHGQPRFILDETYRFQPTNQPRQWVLLREGTTESPNGSDAESPRFFYSNQNLHAVATLHDQLPPIQNDAGERGDYAITLDSDKQFGTVYEIGWQREMGVGTSHPCYGRRIYVLHDHSDHWQFLGEGPEEGAQRGASDTLKSGVIWQNAGTNQLPLKIQFHDEEVTTPYNSRADDTNIAPNLVTCKDSVLVGQFPARLHAACAHPYLVAANGDTIEKIVWQLAYYLPGWETPPKDQIQKMWRQALRQLNPGLPRQGDLAVGTRINILTYGEVVNRLQASGPAK